MKDRGLKYYEQKREHWASSFYETRSLQPLDVDSSQLCANNIQDHGEYNNDVDVVKPILSNCTSMTVKIVNNNHVELLNPAGASVLKLDGIGSHYRKYSAGLIQTNIDSLADIESTTEYQHQ